MADSAPRRPAAARPGQRRAPQRTTSAAVVAPAAAKLLLATASTQLNQGENKRGATKYGRFYGLELRKGRMFVTAPWCAMFAVWCAYQVGYERHIPVSASTIAMAKWFAAKGQWGTEPVPGAFVFYDWQQTGKINGIDHVGLVESVLPRKIRTIEGNTSNLVKRRERARNAFVVGYGYPKFPVR